MKDLEIKGSFSLELGGKLDYPIIRYHTFGKLNEAKDNVIMVVHALTANSNVSDWWNGLYGMDNLFDPEKYFIICANNLGSPYGTTSAKSTNPTTQQRYGLDYPDVTLRDTARLHLRLLEELGIDKIKFLMGGSCGGNISQEMAIIRPNLAENLILLCCAAKESAWAIGIHEAQRIALRADPELQDNRNDAAIKGLKAARAMALPYYRSYISFKEKQSDDHLDKTSDFRASSYMNYQGEKFVNRFDAHCYYKLLSTLDTHNVGRLRGSVPEALEQIKSNTLVIGFDTDLFIPPMEQQYVAEHIPGAKYAEIQSLYGHDAFLIESNKIRTVVMEHYGLK